MSPSRFEQNFSGEVPIFPLPNVVFFPGTKLPLYIFEPRYRQMLMDVHDGEGLVAVVLLDRLGLAKPYQGLQPPIHLMAGLGCLTRVDRLSKSLFSIDLFGLTRVRILEELKSAKPYRIARVEMVRDEVNQSVESRSDEIMGRAFKALNRVMRKYSHFPGEFLTCFRGLPVGMLLDILAHHVPCDTRHKQLFLEETQPLLRCDRIVETLDNIYRLPDPDTKVPMMSSSLFPYPSLN